MCWTDFTYMHDVLSDYHDNEETADSEDGRLYDEANEDEDDEDEDYDSDMSDVIELPFPFSFISNDGALAGSSLPSSCPHCLRIGRRTYSTGNS